MAWLSAPTNQVIASSDPGVTDEINLLINKPFGIRYMALAVFSCKCYSILTWNEQSEFGVYKKKTKEKSRLASFNI